MTCLKCGRETDQTFCEECRAVMEKYPVKPGTIIQIPKGRGAASPKRSAPRRPVITPEARIAGQKKMIRALWIVVAAEFVLLLAMGGAGWRILHSASEKPVGQNYSTVTKATADEVEIPTEEETRPMND